MNDKEDELQETQEELEKYQSIVHTLRGNNSPQHSSNPNSKTSDEYLLALSQLVFPGGN